MAIDFDEIFRTMEEIHEKTGDLLAITERARTAAGIVNHVGVFQFTVAQKTDLKDKYNSLKAELVSLFGNLP